MKLLHYFERYPLCKRELASLEGQLRFLPPNAGEEKERLLRQINLLRGEMENIRLSLAHCCAASPNAGKRELYRCSDEKLFLECRYIQGLTVEKTAEAMCISRDTAFRIRRRLANREIDLPTPAA